MTKGKCKNLPFLLKSNKTLDSQFKQHIQKHLNQQLIAKDVWFGSALNSERAAAVLFPFYWRDGEPWVLLTQRHSQLKHHSGQVSFPGGAYENQDKNIRHTALRETEEEIGVPRSRIDLWGFLDSVESISGFYVTPFVGEIKQADHLNLCEDEVERTFGVPFAYFQAPQNRINHRIKTGDGVKEYAEFTYNGDVIWGLTAQIIVQLVNRLKPKT
ncbi:coenzyme A pyrophosphatase [Marinicella pacifica]|uniref:Coenzyme A pyrophosphatase n=1 Tax=Marinicella pacifica TaxID=1171543 RepID=A0A917CFB8_9GAMM|nr:CoA pyrophosphatase [Marinicella pacifica]GGF84453.1 coenzyme A pyrophosphatase [Marinicella pacifica]